MADDTGAHHHRKQDKTISPSCIRAHGAEASQQLPGILNREGPKRVWEFKKMFPGKCLLHPFKGNNKNKVKLKHAAFVCQTSDSCLFQQDMYPPLPCQCTQMSTSVIFFQTEACPHE